MRLFELASAETEDRFADLLRASTKSPIHNKPQLYVPRNPSFELDDPGSDELPTADQRFDSKPGDRKPENGFWTSTATETDHVWQSAWSEWTRHEMPSWAGEKGILFYPKAGAKILEMNTDDDFREIYNLYVDLTNAKHSDEGPDYGDGLDAMKVHRNFPWPWVAQHWDAVHTTSPNRWGLHMASWDVESTVWFNMNVLGKVGEVQVAV
jgi:hypothetical protein